MPRRHRPDQYWIARAHERDRRMGNIINGPVIDAAVIARVRIDLEAQGVPRVALEGIQLHENQDLYISGFGTLHGPSSPGGLAGHVRWRSEDQSRITEWPLRRRPYVFDDRREFIENNYPVITGNIRANWDIVEDVALRDHINITPGMRVRGRGIQDDTTVTAASPSERTIHLSRPAGINENNVELTLLPIAPMRRGTMQVTGHEPFIMWHDEADLIPITPPTHPNARSTLLPLPESMTAVTPRAARARRSRPLTRGTTTPIVRATQPPNEALMPLPSTRTFGVELEINKPTTGPHTELDHTGLARLLNAAGVRCRGGSLTYDHIDSPTHWKIVSDATVPLGYELVSPILKGEDGLEQIRKVSKVLVDCRYGVDISTGFHVHIGFEDMTPQQICDVLVRYGKHEKEIDWMVAKSRRTGNSNCQSLDNWMRNPVFNDVGRARSMEDVLGRISYNSRTHINELQGNRVEGYSRFSKVNLFPYLRGHDTIEFRHHQGTIEADKIINWVSFLMAFIEATNAKAWTHAIPLATTPMFPVLNHVRKTYRGETTKAWDVARFLLDAPGAGFSRSQLSYLVGQGVTQISVILEHFKKKGPNFGLVITKVPGQRTKYYKLVPPEIYGPAIQPVRIEDTWKTGVSTELVNYYVARQTHFKRMAGVPQTVTA